MLNDLFLTSALQPNFSFGFTTELSNSIEPEVTAGLGEITVEFPPFLFDVNQAPAPVDDFAETEAGTAVDINVLANDEDPDGDQLVVLAAADPTYGSVEIIGDVVTYTPDEGFSGTDTFTYTVFDGFDFAEATVTIDVQPEEVEEPTGGGDKSGFELVRLNDFFNPAYGGGFIATYEYTVTEASIIGEDLFAWTIDSGYTGEGTIVNVFVNGFNGPTNRSDDGTFDIGNTEVGFRPELNIGDTFEVSFQIDGAGFEEEHFCPVFLDSDPEPFVPAPSDVEITAAPTNDWGSGFLQTVEIENISGDEIDGWSVILDVPEGDTFVFNNVWGATAETLDNGDILFENLSWNEDIAAGGSVNFGFTGDNSTNDTVSLDEFDFTFLG